MELKQQQQQQQQQQKQKKKLRKQKNLKKVSALVLRVAFCTEVVAIKEMSFSSRANVRLFCQIRWLDL